MRLSVAPLFAAVLVFALAACAGTTTEVPEAEASETSEPTAPGAGPAAGSAGNSAAPRRTPCDIQDARAEGDCDMIVPGFAWNGRGCAPLNGGCRCVGADCDAVYATLEACQQAHLPCPRSW